MDRRAMAEAAVAAAAGAVAQVRTERRSLHMHS